MISKLCLNTNCPRMLIFHMLRPLRVPDLSNRRRGTAGKVEFVHELA